MMINVEKSAIVVDVGSRYLKCGMSGERSPRTVLRWEVAEKLLIQPPLSKDAWLKYIGNQLYDVCYKHLRVAPKNRRVVLCEDLLFPRNLREALVDVVFNVLKAKQLLLLPAMTTALYATCQTTALIVDAGWHETRILPVFERHPLLHAYTTTSVGSRACCTAISKEVPPAKSAEDVLERACFVATPQALEVAKDADFFAFTPHAFTVPANTRSQVVEALFHGDDDLTIPDAIRECVAKCPVDTRRALLANIVCIGGTSMLPGFTDRLAAEVAPDHGRVVSTLFPPHFMTWIGASVYGSTDAALAHAISADTYAPVVDDWMRLP